LASQFAIAARQFAETATDLATLGKSGADYTRLREAAIEAQARSDAAFTLFTEHVASHHCGEDAQDGQENLRAEEQAVA
jgi:hypothetical protein